MKVKPAFGVNRLIGIDKFNNIFCWRKWKWKVNIT